MKTLTDEEKYEIEVWYVLRKVKDEFHYPQLDEDEIEYSIILLNNRIHPDMPFLIDERKILDWLSKKKVVRMIDTVQGIKGPLISQLPNQKEIKMIVTYHLKIPLLNFKEFYQKYQVKCERKMKKLLNERSCKNNGLMTKHIYEIIGIKRIIGKEEKLLEILSDLQPHETKKLAREIGTKDLKHIKGELRKKLIGTDFRIKTDRGYSLESSYYQLEYLPINQ